METHISRDLFPTADHYLGRDKHVFSFSSNHPIALKASPKESIHIQTWDCYMGAITGPENSTQKIDESKINGATGPIYIEGAMPGDTLSIEILDIKPNKQGVARLFPGEGQLSQLIESPYAQFFEIINDQIRMNDRVAFSLKPMIGVIGVAPEFGEISTMPAGRHGGNLDNNLNGIGSIVHLPVKHQGALLAIGDMHASMGDGEICGTGIEIGGDVLISTQIIKSKSIEFPVTETNDYWITHGVANEDISTAIKIACQQATQLLVNEWGFTTEDAFIFLSVVGDVGIAQNVHPSKGTVIARMKVPKLSACPTPFNVF